MPASRALRTEIDVLGLSHHRAYTERELRHHRHQKWLFDNWFKVAHGSSVIASGGTVNNTAVEDIEPGFEDPEDD